MVGPFADDPLETRRIEELVGVGAKVQNDVGAGLLTLGWADRERAAAVRGPRMGAVRPCPARDYLDTLGHHEGGVKPDPELPDQGRTVLGACLGQLLAEGACPRT